MKNVEWKQPLGKGLRRTAQVADMLSGFFPVAGIIKGATSMVADMLDPPVTLEQIRDGSLFMKTAHFFSVYLNYKHLSIASYLLLMNKTNLGHFKRI